LDWSAGSTRDGNLQLRGPENITHAERGPPARPPFHLHFRNKTRFPYYGPVAVVERGMHSQQPVSKRFQISWPLLHDRIGRAAASNHGPSPRYTDSILYNVLE
jgi:hypothetical protein